MRVVLAMAILLLVSGCVLPPAGPNGQPSPLAQAQAWYVETGIGLEQARQLVLDYKAAGRLSPDAEAECMATWNEAALLLKRWKNLLAVAEVNNGVLPADHPFVMLAAQESLARLRARLIAGGQP